MASHRTCRAATQASGVAIATVRIWDELASRRQAHSIFVIELRARPGTDGIRSLRALLKRLDRGYGLHCIAARVVQR